MSALIHATASKHISKDQWLWLGLPFVALLELTILGVVPELASLVGGGIIAAAAIYMARREARIRTRSLAAESKTHPKT